MVAWCRRTPGNPYFWRSRVTESGRAVRHRVDAHHCGRCVVARHGRRSGSSRGQPRWQDRPGRCALRQGNPHPHVVATWRTNGSEAGFQGTVEYRAHHFRRYDEGIADCKARLFQRHSDRFADGNRTCNHYRRTVVAVFGFQRRRTRQRHRGARQFARHPPRAGRTARAASHRVGTSGRA